MEHRSKQVQDLSFMGVFYNVEKLVFDCSNGDYATIPLTAEEINALQPTLDQIKQAKIAQLDAACNEAILGSFNSTVNSVQYSFSNDGEAQKNFDKCARAFDKGYISSIPWTAYDASDSVTRITLDAAAFEPLYMDHLSHIQSNIAKYRDILQPQVEAATTKEEIDAIQW